jgi:hypothetical protein
MTERENPVVHRDGVLAQLQGNLYQVLLLSFFNPFSVLSGSASRYVFVYRCYTIPVSDYVVLQYGKIWYSNKRNVSTLTGQGKTGINLTGLAGIFHFLSKG